MSFNTITRRIHSWRMDHVSFQFQLDFHLLFSYNLSNHHLYVLLRSAYILVLSIFYKYFKNLINYLARMISCFFFFQDHRNNNNFLIFFQRLKTCNFNKQDSPLWSVHPWQCKVKIKTSYNNRSFLFLLKQR